LGFFKDVQVDVEEFEGGLRVTFVVVEEPFVRDIAIVGAQAIKREEIEGKLSLKANSVLNRNQVRDSLDKIKQLYQEKGYYFAEAEAVYTDVGPEEIDLTIRLTEGEKILIKRITFMGNRAIEPWELKNVMETKEANLLSFITGTGVYQRETLRNDLRRLEAFYQTRGFLRVEISEPDVRVDRQAKGIFITIAVKEQEQYHVGRLQVAGDDLFSDHVLDQWVARTATQRCHGYCALLRYADDTLAVFEREDDARRFMWRPQATRVACVDGSVSAWLWIER